jgi:hypothetical protein
MKGDALREGLPIPNEAAVRDRVLRKHVEAPDLVTMKDFLRFHTATSKGKIRKIITSNSLNAFAEWFFAGFCRVTDTSINEADRTEVQWPQQAVQKAWPGRPVWRGLMPRIE